MVRRSLARTLFAAMCMAVAFALDPASGQEGKRSWEGTILARSLNVRAGPGEGHEIVASLPRGAKVIAFDEDGRWINIREFDDAGTIGWVHRSFVRLPEDFLAPAFGEEENAFLEWASQRGDLAEVSVDADDRLSLVLTGDATARDAEAIARAVACEWRARLSVEGRVVATVWPPQGPSAGWLVQAACP